MIRDRREGEDSQLPDRLLASAGSPGSGAEARAARLLASMSPARDLSSYEVARIQARIAGSWSEPRRGFARPVLVFGTLGLMAFAAAGAFAGRQLVSGFARGPEIVALPRAALPHAPARHRAAPAAVAVPVPEEAPLVAPAPEPPAARRRARAPEKGGLAEESRVIGAALALLHRQHDARGALARLDDHDARFPGGELQREATMARIEALLMTARSRDALRLLDAVQPGRTPRDAEILVVRGELRAEAGRCVEAERDFAAALARTGRGTPAERALFGRASCRSRRGDAAGARGNLNAYLAAFPDGRFAAKARAALASAPSAAD